MLASKIIPSVRSATPNLISRRMTTGPLTDRPDIDSTFHQKFVRVCVLGADTPTGQSTSFLLKQNPLVSQVYLHGHGDVQGIAADLKHLDTRCEVKAYHGNEGLPKALRRADIVLMIGTDKASLNSSPQEKLRSEASRIVDLAEACSRYAPKSMITVCAHPVSATLPLVTAVFRRTHWYHPGRIIGSVALIQVRVNTMAARYQDLDPVSVHVPLIGGPDADCVVPLYSRASPVNIPPDDCHILHERTKDIENLVQVKTERPCKLESAPLSEAYAINRLVTTIGLGLCGDSQALCTAFVRQSILHTCKHLVCTVKFGPEGVVHNYGVPRLTHEELKHLEKAALLLAKREQLVLDVLARLEGQTSDRNPAKLKMKMK